MRPIVPGVLTAALHWMGSPYTRPHAPVRSPQGGREALLRYVLRSPLAQERLELRPDGLVRITLKKAYADGTVAVDMDPQARTPWKPDR